MIMILLDINVVSRLKKRFICHEWRHNVYDFNMKFLQSYDNMLDKKIGLINLTSQSSIISVAVKFLCLNNYDSSNNPIMLCTVIFHDWIIWLASLVLSVIISHTKFLCEAGLSKKMFLFYI